MRFSFDWLSDLSGYKGSPEKLAELLSLHSFETEVDSQSFRNIIVAKVTKVAKHPNADRLRVITLSDGKNIYSPVVCGAWNFDVGAVVPLALPGAIIPHDQHDPQGRPFTLGKASIRGIESQGMICSAKELGLGTDGGGIMLLEAKSRLGAAFSRPNNNGSIFEISVPANRPDILSYRGVAWEISAITGSKYKIQPSGNPVTALKSKLLKVRISEPKLCTKYSALRLSNIEVKPSPKFIQDRLRASGLRPINNVVDITNYLMLEIGQPMHAFDAFKINGPINVRKAYVNETLNTLDGVERKLSRDMLVIADSKKSLAIAGVIGGMDSSVGGSTTEIILESANFNGTSVRKTSRHLGLRTDSSARFEKSLPVGLVDSALSYASELLTRYAAAKSMEYATAGLKNDKPTVIQFDPKKANSLFGLEIPPTEHIKILKRFGFGVMNQKATFAVKVPFWRPDVRIWQDLAEEVVRFKGLDQIPNIAAAVVPSSAMSDPLAEARVKISDLLVALGFDETYTYSFTPRNRSDSVQVANPQASDQQYLRQDISMNYEKLIEQNSNYEPDGDYFEIGNVYRRQSGRISEHSSLLLLSYSRNTLPADRFLGSLREFFARLGISYQISQQLEQEGEVMIGNKKLGPIRAEASAEVKWIAAELNFEDLVKFIQPNTYQPVSRFPGKDLDVAILVKDSLPWKSVRDAILDSKFDLVNSVDLREVYQGKNIPPGKKSLTIRIRYISPVRTLTDMEVEKIHKQILAVLERELSAQIRD